MLHSAQTGVLTSNGVLHQHRPLTSGTASLLGKRESKVVVLFTNRAHLQV